MSQNMWSIVKGKLTGENEVALGAEKEEQEFEGSLGRLDTFGDYSLPVDLNKRLIEKAHSMNLESCELLQLIIELALSSKSDIREDFLKDERLTLLKYFEDKTEINLDGTIIFYEKVEIELDVNIEENKFDLVVLFLQNDKYVAKKIIKPIENYLG